MLVRAAAWLFAAAVAFGAAMAALRFGFERPSPRWLRRTHGGFAGLGLAALGVASIGADAPRLAGVALVLLTLAAVGGLVTTRARRWRLPVSTEALAFVHLSVAALGVVVLLAAAIGGRP